LIRLLYNIGNEKQPRAVADPWGQIGATVLQKRLWRPLEWRPFAKNAPFLVSMEVET